MDEVLLFKLTWPEVKEYLKNNDVILVPTGSNEQHGKHLAEDMDTFSASQVSKRVAEKTGVLVAPAVPFGYSPHHMGFPGTITISFENLVNLYKDICKSLLKHGFKKIVLMNAHGGNTNAIAETLRQMKEETGVTIYSTMIYPMSSPNSWANQVVRDTIKTGGGHSDEMETSAALYLGQRVLMNQAEKGVPPEPQDPLRKTYGGKITTVRDFHEITVSGVLGEPTLATKEKGKTIMEAGIAEIASFIEALKKQ